MNDKMIFFDLDGTITDSAEGIINSIKYALVKHNLPMLSEEELRSFIGPPLREQFCKMCHLTLEEGSQMVETYREYYKKQGIFENQVYDGVINMLELLKMSGFRLVIATSKPEKYARLIADHFGFSKYFDYIAGACMDGSRTEKHAVIEYALEQMEVTERNLVTMVGDRSHDIYGAQKAQLHSIGVLYGYGSREELRQAGAEILAETPEEVARILCDQSTL